MLVQALYLQGHLLCPRSCNQYPYQRHYLFDSYDPFLGFLVGDDIKHIMALTICDAVLDLRIFSHISITGFDPANWRSRWRGLRGLKLVGTY